MSKSNNDYSASFRPLSHWQPKDAYPMYSYDRPATIFWSAFMNGLIDNGFTEAEAVQFLRSKYPRWMLDNHDERLRRLARNMAKEQATESAKADCARWVAETTTA